MKFTLLLAVVISNCTGFSPKPQTRCELPCLRASLAALESSLGPLLPITATLASASAAFVAYNYDNWRTAGGLELGVDVEIKDAGGRKGRGAFALKHVRKGTICGRYAGQIVTMSELSRNFAQREGGVTANGYIFELDNFRYIDASEIVDESQVNWTRRINHSSSPNLLVETNALLDLVWFEAKRDIVAGEELCFDYGNRYWEGFEEDKNGEMVPKTNIEEITEDGNGEMVPKTNIEEITEDGLSQ